MPQVRSYKQGTPCWVNLAAADVEAASAFYSALFGWELDAMPAAPGMTYYMARLRDRYVAGMMQQMPDMTAAGLASRWETYLAVDNADEAAARATQAGGTLLVPVTDIPDGAGRMFFATDPTGAGAGFWQAGSHSGAGLAGEPGTAAWNELHTGDISRAVPFYQAVTGCSTVPGPAGQHGESTAFVVDGQPVAGARRQTAPGLPPSWRVYFEVEDVDLAAARAQELGSQVLRPASDVPWLGRAAVLADPNGAAFGLLAGGTGGAP